MGRARVALVKPFDPSDSIQPNLGLGYLAAALSPRHDVALADCILERLTPAALTRTLQPFHPDIIGLQLSSFAQAPARACLLQLRSEFPRATIVVGGSHPTLAPRDTLVEFGPLVDFAVRGEGEAALLALADHAADGLLDESACRRIPGLVWKGRDGEIHLNRTARTDLARLPLPRWDLMDPRRFPPAPHAAFFRRFPVAPVIASRGCPHQCTFCAGGTIHGRRLRYRSLDSVLEETSLLHDRYEVREIHFVDDNLTEDQGYVHELCDRILALPFRLAWSCPNGVRLDSLDRPLLEHMKAAGCYALGLGIESGSPRILARMRKGFDLDAVRSQVALIHDVGLETRGFFVLGYPGETREDLERTVALSLELPLDIAHYMFFHPIPGTPAFRAALADGQNGDHNGVDAPTFAEVAHVPRGMTRAELRQLRREALVRFYLRPSRLWHLLSQVQGPGHLYYLGRRVTRWLA